MLSTLGILEKVRRIQAQHWGFLSRVNFHAKGFRSFIVKYLLEPFNVEDIRFVAVFYSWLEVKAEDSMAPVF